MLIGSLKGNFPEYSSLISYSIDSYCVYEGKIYKSLIDNPSSLPDANTTEWEELTIKFCSLKAYLNSEETSPISLSAGSWQEIPLTNYTKNDTNNFIEIENNKIKFLISGKYRILTYLSISNSVASRLLLNSSEIVNTRLDVHSGYGSIISIPSTIIVAKTNDVISCEIYPTNGGSGCYLPVFPTYFNQMKSDEKTYFIVEIEKIF